MYVVLLALLITCHLLVGCHSSWHSSYNHWGETNYLTLDVMTNTYGSPMEYDISVTGDAGNDDSYGGVATYELTNGNCDVCYLASSADILDEPGPHGISVWNSNSTNSPLSTLGAFSYGVLEGDDPKGLGADVEVYNGCNFNCDISGATESCEGEDIVLIYTPECPMSMFTWVITDGDAIISGANNETTVTITAGTTNYTVTLYPTGSAATCTYDIIVTPLAYPTIDAVGPFCLDDPIVVLNATPAGGTLSEPGVDEMSNSFDPSIAGAGTHTITYSIPGICMAF